MSTTNAGSSMGGKAAFVAGAGTGIDVRQQHSQGKTRTWSLWDVPRGRCASLADGGQTA
jgi:hypothetical protein